ncbi:hypothetical protein SEVIR_4G200601v4 [Setaria viridis]
MEHPLVVAAMEHTFIMIKPDDVQRGLIGEIISRFEKKGFYLKALKLVNVERSFAEKHYSDLSAKPFFQGLVDYIIFGPAVAMVWEGKSVVTLAARSSAPPTPWLPSPAPSVVTLLSTLAGMSFMEVTALRVLPRRFPCGSPRASPTGRAATRSGWAAARSSEARNLIEPDD